jgi:hypothetical protein
MIRGAPPADLGPIATHAITEVLATQFELPASESASVERPIAAQTQLCLVGSVRSESGGVHLQAA